MVFRQAVSKEKDIILSMYDEYRDEDFTAWDETYPTMENILKDMETGNLFVLEDGNEIVGAVSVNYENELQDEKLFSSGNALEFGRIVVEKKYRGRGYGKLLVENIEKEILKRGYENIHIIVYKNAPVANAMYKSLKYTYLGERNYFDYDFYLYEKKIGLSPL